MLEQAAQRFLALAPGVDFCSLRLVEEAGETLSVRNGVVEPPKRHRDAGAMVTVIHQGGYGYAATSDLSDAGLLAAISSARRWAEDSRRRSVFDFSAYRPAHPRGRYVGRYSDRPLDWPRRELLERMLAESADCGRDPRIVDWSVNVEHLDLRQLYLTTSGGEVEQRFRMVIPGLVATAYEGGQAQTRSLGGQYNGYCRQGGLDILDAAGLDGSGARVADEAIQLLLAPNCPDGVMDLLLMPEQMMLQIHESIGHPLELDRILGDERNFAGTSFVDLEMFGHYRYGSELLNVTYDPTLPEEFASYGWDDDGSRADKVWLIRDGLLQHPLGGAISQARAGLDIPGVANSRACNWNRPPIDRMANLNIEPGDQPLSALIGSVERGVLMDTNVSWSIDDSRNKFQFGCEWGRLIENGELKGVVKNPGYRGVSATFWRALKAVGDHSTFTTMGTPFCGKGEPSQVIRVGHAAPACLFHQIEVFGGA